MDAYSKNSPELVTIQCGTCGHIWRTLQPAEACPNCALLAYKQRLTPEMLLQIDDFIQQNRKLEAVRFIKQTLEISLKDAMLLMDERDTELKRN